MAEKEAVLRLVGGTCGAAACASMALAGPAAGMFWGLIAASAGCSVVAGIGVADLVRSDRLEDDLRPCVGCERMPTQSDAEPEPEPCETRFRERFQTEQRQTGRAR